MYVYSITKTIDSWMAVDTKQKKTLNWWKTYKLHSRKQKARKLKLKNRKLENIALFPFIQKVDFLGIIFELLIYVNVHLILNKKYLRELLMVSTILILAVFFLFVLWCVIMKLLKIVNKSKWIYINPGPVCDSTFLV